MRSYLIDEGSLSTHRAFHSVRGADHMMSSLLDCQLHPLGLVEGTAMLLRSEAVSHPERLWISINLP